MTPREQLLLTLQLEEVLAYIRSYQDEVIEDELAEIADLISDAIAKQERYAEEGIYDARAGAQEAAADFREGR